MGVTGDPWGLGGCRHLGYWDMRGFVNNILNVSVENVCKIGLQYCKIRLDMVTSVTLWVSLNGTSSWSTVDTPWAPWACKLLSGYLSHTFAWYVGYTLVMQ